MRHCTDKPLCVPSLKGSPRARYEHVLRNQCRRETVRSTVGRAPFVSYLSSLWRYFILIIPNSVLDTYIHKLFWFPFRNESLVYLSFNLNIFQVWSNNRTSYRRGFEVSSGVRNVRWYCPVTDTVTVNLD